MAWKMENKVYSMDNRFYWVKKHYRIQLLYTFDQYFVLCEMVSNSICLLNYVFPLLLTRPLRGVFRVAENILENTSSHAPKQGTLDILDIASRETQFYCIIN